MTRRLARVLSFAVLAACSSHSSNFGDDAGGSGGDGVATCADTVK